MRLLQRQPGQPLPTRVHLVGRLLLGPAAAGTFAGIELRAYRAFTAAAGAYLTFALSQIAVDLWMRWQQRLARRRFEHARERLRLTREAARRDRR